MVGIEIGSVSVKIVRLREDSDDVYEIIRHEGNPKKVIRALFDKKEYKDETSYTITGHSAKELLNLPHRSETECIEKALSESGVAPDIVMSLGGELFTLYTLKDGKINDISVSSKCAAGTGEFFIQQLRRMNFSLEQGIEISQKGKRVPLSSRCSVHCKSDATHKLNKGECETADIARSLVEILADKVFNMLSLVDWPKEEILITGGISLNAPFIEILKDKLKDTRVVTLKSSPFIEAFGAALYAENEENTRWNHIQDNVFKEAKSTYEIMRPLSEAEKYLTYQVLDGSAENVRRGAEYILGIDAGSTTTKAALVNTDSRQIECSCYLRTHGNPVASTVECLKSIRNKIGDTDARISQVAVTGSGRELVSVFLGGAESYNEILAHGRAATEYAPDVDTVFEIGGQDSKYISFSDGVPVDYEMNDGCSAGTGSFLEETVQVDMGVTVYDINKYARKSENPIGFGEQCAAFINTDLRTALQEGADKNDVIAGIVYSIAKNYIARVVGINLIGDNILFQGGVALNRSVALSLASITEKKIVVPPRPELMGCLGSGLMILDKIKAGEVSTKNISLNDFISGSIKVCGTFQCKKCEDRCEIERIEVKEKVYPFGGKCSRYTISSSGKSGRKEGRNLIKERNRLTFETYGPAGVKHPKGSVGIPRALTAYEYFPLYSKFFNALGYEVAVSEVYGKEGTKAIEDSCFPCRIAYDSVNELFERGLDFVFLPHLVEAEVPDGYKSSFMCPNTIAIPSVIKHYYASTEERILTPVLNLTEHSFKGTLREMLKISGKLGAPRDDVTSALKEAYLHYDRYCKEKQTIGKRLIENLNGDRAILLAGKPYVTCSPKANLALPQKIISRGYHAVPVDMLPVANRHSEEYRHPGNVWMYTQQVSNAIALKKEYENLYLCIISCFSCVSDGVMLHDFRQKLNGDAYCYLEIDSHTAHAGFETRLGAFLDIVDQK